MLTEKDILKRISNLERFIDSQPKEFIIIRANALAFIITYKEVLQLSNSKEEFELQSLTKQLCQQLGLRWQ